MNSICGKIKKLLALIDDMQDGQNVAYEQIHDTVIDICWQWLKAQYTENVLIERIKTIEGLTDTDFKYFFEIFQEGHNAAADVFEKEFKAENMEDDEEWL